MAKRRKKTKAQRRAIANSNLVKARRARWKGHHKKVHRKLTKVQRRKVAMRNLKKAWHSHGKRPRSKRKGSKPSKAARRFISKKIGYLMKHEGYGRFQAEGIAYSMARRRGFRVPY